MENAIKNNCVRIATRIIYEQEQPDGRFLKHIKFRFPVYFNGSEIEELSWDNENTVETVVLMSKVK